MKTARLSIGALLFAGLPAWGQCSLCRLTVEQDASLGTAFNKAIILLMIPALAIFAGVFLLAARTSPDSRKEETHDDPDLG